MACAAGSESRTNRSRFPASVPRDPARKDHEILALVAGRTACTFVPLRGDGRGDQVLDVAAGLPPVVIRLQGRRYPRLISVSAVRIGSGIFFPRFSARRRIPRAASRPKKYFCGRPPVSKISDKEDAAAPLGDSEVLSVQHSPCHAIPAVIQRLEDLPEGLASVNGKHARDVFPDDPAGTNFRSQPEKVQGDVSPRIGNPEPFSGDAERLAGSASDENVWLSMC